MRIVQLLPTLSFGDAIGNDTIALRGAIRDMGFDTDIYAENIDKRLPAGSVPRQGVFIMTADRRKVKHSVCGGCRRQPVVDLSGRRLSTGIPAEGRTESWQFFGLGTSRSHRV